MKQLACVLKLKSPFHVVLYSNSTAVILSPLRTIRPKTASADIEICYLVPQLQVPTAEQYQSLVTAIYEKDVVELCHLLSEGLDLTWLTPDGGHTSMLVALAIFRDHDTDAYAYQASTDLRFPQPGVSLTHLLLQALADPNVLPPKPQPTTMLELAVELGSSKLVQLLLEAGATVTSEESSVPPLLLAVLHRHRDNVRLLLNARADPWQEVPTASIIDHPRHWYGHLSRREVFNAVQASAAQGPVDTVIDLLTQNRDALTHLTGERSPHPQPKLTAMTERATVILNEVVWKYQHIIQRQSTRTNFTIYRWRRILAGLYLPVRIRSELPSGLNQEETFSNRVD